MLAECRRGMQVGCTVLCLAGSLSLAGCVGNLQQLEQTPRQRATVVAGVKAALISEPQVDAAAIQVNVIDKQLILQGYVASDKESRRASDIASQNADGLTVINRLEVR